MTTQADLLRAILDDPTDDDVRLVYADWLDDHDQSARAEFIRAQIATAKYDDGDPLSATARQTSNELLTAHRTEWDRELPELPDGVDWASDYRRGFIDSVVASAPTPLLECERVILDSIPLTRLRLIGWEAGNSLAGTKLLERTRELEIHRHSTSSNAPPRDDPLLGEIRSWPEVRHIARLELHWNELSEVGIEQLVATDFEELTSFEWAFGFHDRLADPNLLAEAEWWSKLTRLKLESTTLTPASIESICHRLDGKRLRWLGFPRCRVSDEAVRVLCDSGLLESLERLDLEGNHITEVGLELLLEVLPNTARLLIENNPYGDVGLRLLAESPLLERLGGLRSARGSPGESGAVALGASSFARNLTRIDLSNDRCGSDGAHALLTSDKLESLNSLALAHNSIDCVPPSLSRRLAWLDLRGNPLLEDSLVLFFRASRMPELEQLLLDSTGLGSWALRELAGAIGFPKLRRLSLEKNPIGDVATIALMNAKGMPALRSVEMHECDLTDTFLRGAMDAPLLDQLERLAIRRNSFDEDLYLDFCEAALERGCNVDWFSSRTRYYSIRRNPDGPVAVEDRRRLTTWVESVTYQEYGGGGWLKAASVLDLRDSLRQGLFDPEPALALERYGDDPTSLERQREALAVFLGHHLVGTIPESIGVWDDDAFRFEPISPEQAFAIVERVVEASEQNPHAEIHGRMPVYIDPDEEPSLVRLHHIEPTSIPYAQLRRWFCEGLLDIDKTVFLLFSESEEVTLESESFQLVGMDGDIIATVWFE